MPAFASLATRAIDVLTVALIFTAFS